MAYPTLHQFFRHQLEHGFHARGLTETSTVDYVSDVLARFAETGALYAIKDADSRPLEHIVDLLAAQSEQGQTAGGRSREAFIVRHIGEYTLFMSGLFRERVKARGELNYYVAHGRQAFWRSADFEPNPRRQRIYRRLYQDFSPISDILDALRRVGFPLTAPATAKHMMAALWRV